MKNNIISTPDLLKQVGITHTRLRQYRYNGTIKKDIDYITNGTDYIYLKQAVKTLKDFRAKSKPGRKPKLKPS